MQQNSTFSQHNIYDMVTYMIYSHLARVSKVRNLEYIKAFGEHVKRIRLQKDLSREDIAAHSGIEVMQLYRIETGKINTTISTVLALSKALGVPPKKLMDFEFVSAG